MVEILCYDFAGNDGIFLLVIHVEEKPNGLYKAPTMEERRK